MIRPKTLFEHAGVTPDPGSWSASTLVLIDVQNEYVSGALALPGVEPALTDLGRLLERARGAGAPIIHVVHHGKPGGLFDPTGPMSAIAAPLGPGEGEAVVVKSLPNAFTSQDFRCALARTDRKRIVVGGFMTHMCVSATIRAALDQGVASTVVADCCATRDLPGPSGGVVPAGIVHEASLAALGDRFAAVVRTADEVPD